jgi:hypothetical protein
MQKSTEEIVKFLRNYNSWRRGEHDNMPEPKEIGCCIDSACDILEDLINIEQNKAK